MGYKRDEFYQNSNRVLYFRGFMFFAWLTGILQQNRERGFTSSKLIFPMIALVFICLLFLGIEGIIWLIMSHKIEEKNSNIITQS